MDSYRTDPLRVFASLFVVQRATDPLGDARADPGGPGAGHDDGHSLDLAHDDDLLRFV